jgi:hypothetical protein
MPTLSASDYTTFLKFKAAATSPIRPAIQTRDNATLSQSVLNANTLTSQAAFAVNPYNTTSTVLGTTISAVSTTTVTEARTNVLSAAVGNGTIITYTSSQEHGLSNGNTVTITGFLTFLTANVTDAVVTVNTTTEFTVAVAATGTATGTGSIANRVYYTTSVAHGLVAGDTATITGITTFTASAKTVLAAPTATTFVLDSATTGTAVTGQTGTISGLVYYTTAAAHGLVAGAFQKGVGFGTVLNVSGLTTTLAFNLIGIESIFRVPSTTVFVISSSVTGTAITSQSGVMTTVTTANGNNTLRGTARVIAPTPERTNNPKALSTVSWTSGTSGAVSSTTSSKFQQAGGLPAKNVVGTYTRLPQNAGWIQGNMVSSGPKRF